MKKNLKKIIITGIVIACLAIVIVLLSMRDIENFSAKYAGVDLTKDVQGLERIGTYTGYLLDHADAKMAASDVDIDIYNYKVILIAQIYLKTKFLTLQ